MAGVDIGNVHTNSQPHSGIAQLAEQGIVNPWVVGSSPTPRAMIIFRKPKQRDLKSISIQDIIHEIEQSFLKEQIMFYLEKEN